MENTSHSFNRDRLAVDLRRLGLKHGDSVYVHSSMKRVGWIEGGVTALIDAFLDVLGADGTLLVPTHTYSFTGLGGQPYDKTTTPTGLGAFPEAVRAYPGAYRSGHGSHSSAAIGKNAVYFTENHDPTFAMGYDSPLNRLYRAGGKVLLLGVTHKTNTSIHLAESLAETGYNTLHYDASWGNSVHRLNDRGETELHIQSEFPGCSSKFDILDPHFVQAGIVQKGRIGDADSQLLQMKPMLDITISLLKKDRAMFFCENEKCPCCPPRRKHLAETR